MAKKPKEKSVTATALATKVRDLRRQWQAVNPFRWRAVKVIHVAPDVCRVIMEPGRALKEIKYPEKLIPVLRK